MASAIGIGGVWRKISDGVQASRIGMIISVYPRENASFAPQRAALGAHRRRAACAAHHIVCANAAHVCAARRSIARGSPQRAYARACMLRVAHSRAARHQLAFASAARAQTPVSARDQRGVSSMASWRQGSVAASMKKKNKKKKKQALAKIKAKKKIIKSKKKKNGGEWR